MSVVNEGMSGGTVGGKGTKAKVRHLKVEPDTVECFEVYLQKRIKYISSLYEYIEGQVMTPDENQLGLPIAGFSIYEADGVFQGVKKLFDERSLIVRVMFRRSTGANAESLDKTVLRIGRDLATKVAAEEEEIWITFYSQGLKVFRPNVGADQEE